MNRSLFTNIIVCSFTGSIIYAQVSRFCRRKMYNNNDYLQDYFNSGFFVGGAIAILFNYLQKSNTPLITNN